MDPTVTKTIISTFAVSFFLLIVMAPAYINAKRWAERLSPVVVGVCYMSMLTFILYFVWTR